LNVSFTRDRLKAYLTVRTDTGVYPTEGDLADCLKRHKIVCGIKKDVLKDMADGRICNAPVLVAEGEPAKQGERAHFELLVDTSSHGRPRMTLDGRVDHRELQMCITVREGQRLVKKTLPTQGSEGRTVSGGTIRPQPVPDIPFRVGAGTRVPHDDPMHLVAAVDGVLVVNTEGYIDVVHAELIPGDIDYATGNITFTGDVTIMGTIRAGFSVDVKGNVHVGGDIEESTVKCSGNLEVAGSVTGAGEGVITCGRKMRSRHVDRFTVRAEDIEILEDVIHSTCTARRKFGARTIVGGTISAGESIEAEVAGAVAGTRTVLDAGGMDVLLEQKREITEEIRELSARIKSCRASEYRLVLDMMDGRGLMTVLDEKSLAEMKVYSRGLMEQRAVVRQKETAVDEKLAGACTSYIKVGKVMPNTMVRFGNAIKIVRDTAQRCIFTVENDAVSMGKY
jgi:hypothetical protein